MAFRGSSLGSEVFVRGYADFELLSFVERYRLKFDVVFGPGAVYSVVIHE